MTTLAPERAPVGELALPETADIFEVLSGVDVPKGWRAEILDGNTITLSPTPIGLHQENVYELDAQLRPHMPEGHRSEGYFEVRIAHLLRSVIPDLFVAPRLALRTQNHWISAEDVTLAAEVVSMGTPEHDRKVKARVYAQAAIELYVLIDPLTAQTTLFSNPSGEEYHDINIRNFGEKLPLPKPFEFDLDTSEFIRY